MAIALTLFGNTAHADDAAGSAAMPPEAFEALADAALACTPAPVDALVAALPAAPDPRAAADALFATARACETRVDEPARALALYQRIVADYPDARVAAGATTRAAHLTQLIGPDGKGAEYARRFLALRSRAGRGVTPTIDPAALVEAEALARSSWPGAGEAALWRADWLRELQRHAESAAAYDDVIARFPDTEWARRAAEGAVVVAMNRRAWTDAQRRIAALPAVDPADRAVRDSLQDELDNRRARYAWYGRSWFALLGSLALLAASLVHAARQPRAILAALRPPAEIMFAAPIVAVMFGAALFSHIAIGPAVATISGGGLAIAWISGSGLAAARRRGEAIRWRVIAHAVLAGIAVCALSFIAIEREGLLDMLIETVRFGPDS